MSGISGKVSFPSGAVADFHTEEGKGICFEFSGTPPTFDDFVTFGRVVMKFGNVLFKLFKNEEIVDSSMWTTMATPPPAAVPSPVESAKSTDKPTESVESTESDASTIEQAWQRG